ncbi:MAG TPA: hypothetical protein VD962_02545 [Rubricoccaceae bacterium]|nr:hypothetical protein [Rubricoccaceae bacterium]
MDVYFSPFERPGPRSDCWELRYVRVPSGLLRWARHDNEDFPP